MIEGNRIKRERLNSKRNAIDIVRQRLFSIKSCVGGCLVGEQWEGPYTYTVRDGGTGESSEGAVASGQGSKNLNRKQRKQKGASQSGIISPLFSNKISFFVSFFLFPLSLAVSAFKEYFDVSFPIFSSVFGLSSERDEKWMETRRYTSENQEDETFFFCFLAACRE